LKKAWSGMIFRRRAVAYCKANGLISDEMGISNKELFEMIEKHSKSEIPCAQLATATATKIANDERKGIGIKKLLSAYPGTKKSVRATRVAGSAEKPTRDSRRQFKRPSSINPSPSPIGKPKSTRIPDDEFFPSREWQTLRYQALVKHGGKCQCCGAGREDGKKLHVDHVKPRSKFPELQLELSNLQVLCEDCNLGKGAWDQTDWRPKLRVVK
jgi:5-methylcytosine-specific restriction endonuclease McrA